MSSLSATSATTHELTWGQRYFVLVVVVLGASLYSTALLTTTTVLPQMQGALSATQDEIAWAMTFNILATAIVTPLTGWLTGRYGIKQVSISSIALFTFATFMCGMSDRLETLVFWRMIQGGAGAPVVPLSQTILLNTFPREQQPVVLSTFGVAVGVAPVLGPVVGGYLAETYSWRWTFHMLVPFGVLAVIGFRAALTDAAPLRTARLDWLGFIALAVAMTGLQLMLARGQRLDWFQSTEIVVEATVAAIGFYVFIVHCLSTRDPFLNLAMLRDRNYLIGLALVTIYGMLNFTPMVLLPPLLQQYMGYSDPLVGQVIGARGIGMMFGFLAGGLMARVDPRIGTACGFGLLVVSGLWMLSFDLSVGHSTLLANSLLQGFAVAVVWVPMSMSAFATLPVESRAEASAIFHLLRNVGSSIFISLSIAEVVAATAGNYSRMSEMITSYNPVIANPALSGAWGIGSTAELAALSREISRQAAMIAYLNAFAMFTVASALAALAALLIRPAKPE